MIKDKLTKQIVRNLRRGLNYKGLEEKTAPKAPFALFEKWIDAAVSKQAFEPNAMTLATVSADGTPSARTVLLKDYSPEGFVFFTNYNSRKGRNLKDNPKASLVFYWPVLSRQVLIDGITEKVDRETSQEYFHSRPRKSQIAAAVSHQSHKVENRQELEKQFQAWEEKYKGKTIPCPKEWGGYVLIPRRIEFWQGRPGRLHDRLCYTRKGGVWKRERLAP